MRKLLAILLLAFFGAPTLTPLFALGTPDAEARLPICCRSHGEHHCAMPLLNASAPRVASPCPRCPRPQATAPGLHPTGFTPAALHADAPASLTLCLAQAEAAHRVSQERSRHKRGPPVVSAS